MALTSAGLSPNSESGATETPSSPKQTRKQVSRACDLCRARRIRCDNGEPCRACHQRGAECTHKGDDEPRTLPAALRDIKRLKLRVRDLEAQIAILKLQQVRPTHVQTPNCSSNSEHAPIQRQQSQSLQAHSSFSPLSIPRPQWRGIHVAAAGSDQVSYYGPASSFYLVGRIGRYLGKMLKQPYPDQSLQPRAAITNPHIAAGAHIDDREPSRSARVGNIQERSDSVGTLDRRQEESLLRLFWEGYHCLLPIIDEVDFRNHYASLWEPSRRSRTQSPLVDIILALCLQYGYAFIPKQGPSQHPVRPDETDDAMIAGRWYYLRAQSLLTADLENPSITTVQCYIFMVQYLCGASFHNMCHIMEAQAVRTAQVLGLHQEPSPDLSYGERELRRRIWWVLWTMDAKTSTKFGRPLVVDWAHVTVKMPSDDIDTASYNGATLGSWGPDVTWLTYSIHTQKVYRIMVDVYDALFFKCGEVIEQNALSCIYHDPKALESCANVLAISLPAMKSWTTEIPTGLKTSRRNGGEAFSTDRSPLEVEVLAPTWLQRQRICLELTYHNMVLNLTRPFITFYSHPNTYTPMAERHATTSVDHGVSFTLIMYQVLTETDLLNGWSEYFSLQWNVAITIVAFILAYPVHSATPRARKALDKAVEVFDIFGTNFSVSADAAMIMRDLITKADFLAGNFRGSTAFPNTSGDPLQSIPDTNTSSSTVQDDLGWLDPSRQDDTGQFGQLMDWALSVDSFNNFEKFFDSNYSVDTWEMEESS
ncbi:fungal-specific transcription factor domain-containing protein [Mariannaea sp. PMI_226]|nr:fungal-specific transcription factor domain-containing protein [Mariannaea sp. PMI_226]